MPLLPLVLPPAVPAALPEAHQQLPQPSQEQLRQLQQQQGQQGQQQMQQPQQMVYTPFSGMMLPPSVLAPGGAHSWTSAGCMLDRLAQGTQYSQP